MKEAPRSPLQAEVAALGFDPHDSALVYALAVKRSLGQYEGLCFIDLSRFDAHGRGPEIVG